MKYVNNNKLGGTQQSVSATAITMLDQLATSGAIKRTIIEEIGACINAAPNLTTDCQIIIEMLLATAAGTATQTNPNPVQVFETGTQVACAATCHQNHTAEPTYTAGSQRLYRAFNQRSSFRWAPLSDDHRPIGPGVAASGWGIRFTQPTASAYLSTMAAECIFSE